MNYYDSLSACLVRYRAMAEEAKRDDLVEFIGEFEAAITNRFPLMKLNRWLGYIQGVLITLGITTVTAERDWTRPYFRPIDFADDDAPPLDEEWFQKAAIKRDDEIIRPVEKDQI